MASGGAKKAFYAAFLDLEDRRVLVVGGGPVATEKTEKLLATGARVRLVSPTITPPLAALVEAGAIGEHHRRGYETTDLDGCFLVIAATNLEDVNRRVWSDAESRNMLVNVVDVPELCNFIVPSVMRRGELAVAVSTGGASPVVARTIRQNIEASYGDEWAELLDILRAVREELKERYPQMAPRAEAVERLLATDVLTALARGEREAALRTTRAVLGVTGPA